MEISRRELRLLLLHEFRLGRKATEATSNICARMGEGVVSYDTAKHWFRGFREGNFELSDEPHPGRPPTINVEELVRLIETDPKLSSRCLAEQLYCSHTAIENNLHALGLTWKYSTWLPHELTRLQLQKRADTCMELLSFHRTTEWLREVITGDEEWVLYVNYTRKRQWLRARETGVPTPKPDTNKKVLLSVWWGINGIIYWELLPTNSTITAKKYCDQLGRIATSLPKNQSKVYFLHDNARPHIAKVTREKIISLGWTVLPHPTYSPDLMPSDFHLFRSLSHYLKDKKIMDEDHLKTELTDFFNQKPKDFYREGIMYLPTRWRQVIENDGSYIIEK